MVQKRAQDIKVLLLVGFLYSVDTLLSLNERTTDRKGLHAPRQRDHPSNAKSLGGGQGVRRSLLFSIDFFVLY
jgi:hypothetical protein